MAKIRAVKKIEALQPEDLADALVENGFSTCRQLIVDKGITGKQFLDLTEFQVKQWRLSLKPSDLNRLWLFMVQIRDHPEQFVLKDASDAEYLNYNPPPISKKPVVPKRPVEVPDNSRRTPNVNLPSPSITIVDSLKNQLQEKFKNVIAESSDDLVEDGSSDWSDDDDVITTETDTLPVPEIDPEVAETKRKLSAEIFVANKNKLEQLFSGVREPEPKIPPRPISLQRTYVNVEELKKEQEEIERAKKEQEEKERSKKEQDEIERAKKEQKEKERAKKEQEEKERATAVKLKIPPKPVILRQQSSTTSLIKKPTTPHKKPEVRISDDFESKRKLLNESLGSSLGKPKPSPPPPIESPGLPLPPKLPPSFKFEGKLIDLTRTPGRPPRTSKLDNGFDEQVPFDDGPPAPFRPPRTARRPELPNEDDTYEPPPSVNFVPKSITNFLDNPPPVPKKFPSPIRTSDSDCDENGYLITVNDVTTSRESLFSKQDTPLPPIPPSTQQYEDELRRNEYFKDVSRDRAIEMFKKKSVGSFLLRPSKKYFCTLVVKSGSHICNVPIIFSSQRFNLLADHKASVTVAKFKSIEELITHYTQNNLNIKGSEILLKP